MFASLGFAGLLMVALAVGQSTWVGSNGGGISAGLAPVSSVDGGGAIATKVTGSMDTRAVQSDLSVPTNSASPATPG